VELLSVEEADLQNQWVASRVAVLEWDKVSSF
jgi:hypothetical protein